MPAIGYVTREGNGFKGELKTLSIRTAITIVPNGHKTSDIQPDYRVTADGVEVGAGWNRRGEMLGVHKRRRQRCAIEINYRSGNESRPAHIQGKAWIAR